MLRPSSEVSIAVHAWRGMSKHCAGWIDTQSDLTLEELQKRLRKELKFQLSISAMWYGLERLG